MRHPFLIIAWTAASLIAWFGFLLAARYGIWLLVTIRQIELPVGLQLCISLVLTGGLIVVPVTVAVLGWRHVLPGTRVSGPPVAG